MHLLPEPLFALPTDNTCMLDMAGTSCTGRIFLGGKDGCLYEILYQVKKGKLTFIVTYVPLFFVLSFVLNCSYLYYYFCEHFGVHYLWL